MDPVDDGGFTEGLKVVYELCGDFLCRYWR